MKSEDVVFSFLHFGQTRVCERATEAELSWWPCALPDSWISKSFFRLNHESLETCSCLQCCLSAGLQTLHLRLSERGGQAYPATQIYQRLRGSQTKIMVSLSDLSGRKTTSVRKIFSPWKNKHWRFYMKHIHANQFSLQTWNNCCCWKNVSFLCFKWLKWTCHMSAVWNQKQESEDDLNSKRSCWCRDQNKNRSSKI